MTRSGGHSEWSTIDSSGIIIDLSKYSGIEVDAAAGTATLRGCVQQKELAVRLAEAGLFTALGNGNTVGVIPYMLGGGVPVTVSITGFGSDQILSARMVDANGTMLDVTEQENSDLLWAIRGAGQFFGLITQLTIRAYPLSALGNDKGVIWAGSFVFPLDRAKDVCSAMKVLMDDGRHATSGLMIITAPPPARKPSLVIAARYTGDPENSQEAYKSLYDLQPIVANGGEIPIQNTSDGRAAVGEKGDFKRFGIVGLRQFDTDSFLKIIDVWKSLIAECPDAVNTAFNFQWDSRPVKAPGFESAMCHHDIRYWQYVHHCKALIIRRDLFYSAKWSLTDESNCFRNNLIWHTDPKNRSKVDDYNDMSISIMRGPDEGTWVDYQNGTRTGPIQLRYRGKERLARLRSLKKKWDPLGVFTNQLLE